MENLSAAHSNATAYECLQAGVLSFGQSSVGFHDDREAQTFSETTLYTRLRRILSRTVPGSCLMRA